jgi:hypothetical protein
LYIDALDNYDYRQQWLSVFVHDFDLQKLRDCLMYVTRFLEARPDWALEALTEGTNNFAPESTAELEQLSNAVKRFEAATGITICVEQDLDVHRLEQIGKAVKVINGLGGPEDMMRTMRRLGEEAITRYQKAIDNIKERLDIPLPQVLPEVARTLTHEEWMTKRANVVSEASKPVYRLITFEVNGKHRNTCATTKSLTRFVVDQKQKQHVQDCAILFSIEVSEDDYQVWKSCLLGAGD